MQTNWDIAIKQARDCQTKQAWEALFESYGEAIATTSNARPLQEIFKCLKADPQSLQYDPRIWGRMLQGCLTCWNLELGREIAEFARPIPSPAVTLPAAQLYLDSGFPSLTREVANRTLRLANLLPAERLQLEILIASSYAEEGKRQKTIRMLNQLRLATSSPAKGSLGETLGSKERADLLTSMGRMNFLLGRYTQAGELFYEASKSYRAFADWEAAAKSIFNTAACHLNAGTKHRDEAFLMIEECRRLAEAHNQLGPLSHCEAAYGLDALQHGDFAAAREHLRRALEYLPLSDKSYRRLHILSMLAYTYLAMGRFHLARKFGRQTLELAAHEESERFKSRYIALQAELAWEDGHIDDSQALLSGATSQFEAHGVHTLEELATLTRFLLQSAMLNARDSVRRVEIDDALKKNSHAWLDNLFARGQLALNLDDFHAAEQCFQECLTRARQTGDRFHEALGLLGHLQSYLRQRRVFETAAQFQEFEVVVARLGETPLRAQVMFIAAALAYQSGDFAECERSLKQALKSPRLSFPDRFVLTGWIATIEGRSFRLTSEWQMQLMARATRTYFAPSLEILEDGLFQVSRHYVVNLEKHPSLTELLRYLLHKTSFAAPTSEIQMQVWKQSLHSQGWQQKIRNTIMRLRDFFPYTMAPLIIHGEAIALFKDAISLSAPRAKGLAPKAEIVRLLADAPMSSQDLAKRLEISPATAKRLLRSLTDEHSIEAEKHGRNIVYKAVEATPP